MGQYEITTIEVEKTITSLVQELKRIQNTTSMKKKTCKKFDNWIRQLETILRKISEIHKVVLPNIKSDLTYSFSNPNHVIIAMMCPSLKNTFNGIKKQFPKGIDPVISLESLDILENGPETAQTLAWIGDSTIKYEIFLDIYKAGISTEELHNKRKSYEEDENLALLCKKWNLFNYRIHLDPPDEKLKSIKKIKGTLTEAIFGVIFIEKGIDGIRDAIPLIKNS
jgi:dsRNA-specific ribonuclease